MTPLVSIFTTPLCRRDALRRLCGAAMAFRGAAMHTGSGGVPLRVGLLYGGDGAGARGARMGVEEGGLTAALVGEAVELVEVPARDAAGRGSVAPAARIEALAAGGAAAVLGALEDPLWDEAERAAESAGLLLLDARVRAGAPGRCGPLTFRVGALPPAPDGVEPLLWHASFDRYGATQLNDRYRRRFGDGMDGPAWAGWFAAKVAVESALRSVSSDPAGLAAFLLAPGAVFDGHKGRPLRFDAAHRLVQPAYVRDPDRGIVELPWDDPEPAACARVEAA